MRYTLCHKTIPVALIEIDESTGTISGILGTTEPERLPMGVGHVGGTADRTALNLWWTGRSIPASRSGLRDALDVIGVTSPLLLLTKCYGLSLSDQYWVRPEHSSLTWEAVNFFDNTFSEDMGNILFGEAADGEGFDLMSPDNTSDGWLQKKWKIIDGKRCLIKSGSNPFHQEPCNEALASAICERLGIPHVPYSLIVLDRYPYSVCEDFVTRDTDLISAWHVMQTRKKPNHMSAYQHYIDCCAALGLADVTRAIDRMLTLDYLIANADRHFNNFGIIRDVNTLELINTAPIYDNGTSLWHNQLLGQIHPDGRLPSKPFRKTHDEQIALVKSFDWIDLSALRDVDEEFSDILKHSAFIDGARRDHLCFGLKRRVSLLEDIIRERSELLPRIKAHDELQAGETQGKE